MEASAVYCLCDVWSLTLPPNKAWERQRGTQQCRVCLDGTGGVCVEGQDPNQTIPPVLYWVAGGSAVQVEFNTAALLCLLD